MYVSGRLTRLACLLATVCVASGGPVNIILLTGESLRHDLVTARTTPRLWRLAEAGGVRFTQHRGSSAWTAGGAISLLTGLSALDHGVHANDDLVPEELTLPLEDLVAAGYRVAGLHWFMKMSMYGNLGLTPDPGSPNEKVFDWLAEAAESGKPFFLWEHYEWTHLPYKIRDGSGPAPDLDALVPADDPAMRERIEAVISGITVPASKYTFVPSDVPVVKALHEQSTAAFDRWFERLWTRLSDLGLLENTIIAFTADHGDEHGERGRVGHASTCRDGRMYETLVRLPMVLWLPPSLAARHPSRTVTHITRHVDVMPTLLALAGIEPSLDLEGQSMLSGQAPPHWMGMTSRIGWGGYNLGPLHDYVGARLEWPWKLHLYVTDGQETARELYNLAEDPSELRDVAVTRAQIGDRLARPLLARMRRAVRDREARLPVAATKAGTRPKWVRPERTRDVSFDDLGGRFFISWTGDTDARYVIDYEAGVGEGVTKGRLAVTGTRRDFGLIHREYWDRFVVPMARIRMRVAPEGSDAWSDWVELRAKGE